jgi:hypothetical protein
MLRRPIFENLAETKELSLAVTEKTRQFPGGV